MVNIGKWRKVRDDEHMIAYDYDGPDKPMMGSYFRSDVVITDGPCRISGDRVHIVFTERVSSTRGSKKTDYRFKKFGTERMFETKQSAMSYARQYMRSHPNG